MAAITRTLTVTVSFTCIEQNIAVVRSEQNQEIISLQLNNFLAVIVLFNKCSIRKIVKFIAIVNQFIKIRPTLTIDKQIITSKIPSVMN